jgi:hypothetical protein
MSDRELADAMARAAAEATRAAVAAGFSRGSEEAKRSAYAAARTVYQAWTGHLPSGYVPDDPAKSRMDD